MLEDNKDLQEQSSAEDMRGCNNHCNNSCNHQNNRGNAQFIVNHENAKEGTKICLTQSFNTNTEQICLSQGDTIVLARGCLYEVTYTVVGHLKCSGCVDCVPMINGNACANARSVNSTSGECGNKATCCCTFLVNAANKPVQCCLCYDGSDACMLSGVVTVRTICPMGC